MKDKRSYTSKKEGRLLLKYNFWSRGLNLNGYSIASGFRAVAFSGGSLFHITRPTGALWTLLWLTVV